MSSILKVDTIQDTDGNNIINESGNTITIGASGDTTNIIGTLQNDGAAVGERNINSFFAHTPASYQSIPNGTFTKVQASVELYDSNSCYDTSNYRYTVPSGQAGKYFFSGGIQMRNDNADLRIIFYVNGSANVGTHYSVLNHSSACKAMSGSKVFNLAASDYVELYVAQGAGSSQDLNDSKETWFCGFKVSS